MTPEPQEPRRFYIVPVHMFRDWIQQDQTRAREHGDEVYCLEIFDTETDEAAIFYDDYENRWGWEDISVPDYHKKMLLEAGAKKAFGQAITVREIQELDV